MDSLVARMNRLAAGSTQAQKTTWLKNHLLKWGVTRGEQGRISMQQLKSALNTLNVQTDGAEVVFRELGQEQSGTASVDDICKALIANDAPKSKPAPVSPPRRQAPMAAWPEDQKDSSRGDRKMQGRYVTEAGGISGQSRNQLEGLARAMHTRFGSMRKAFQWCDLRKDGSLTLEELERALRALNVPNPASEARHMFQVLDKSRDGRVDYNEFNDALQFGGLENNADETNVATHVRVQKRKEDERKFEHTVDGSALYSTEASRRKARRTRG